MKIAVYTAIVGQDHAPKDPVDPSGAELVLYSDQARDVPGWNVRPAPKIFADPRRNSRLPKLLAHQYLPDYAYSIWVDSSCQLVASPCDLIEEHLGDADVAFFRHTARVCLYDEAAACTELGMDDPATIAEQMEKYAQEGYPRHNGLFLGGIIIRRHSPRVEAFNNAWWSEYCRHSCRDQLSLPYVLSRCAVRVTILDVFEHPKLIWSDRM